MNMQTVIVELAEPLHHAYGIVGGEELVPELLERLRRVGGFSSRGNPDYWFGRFESFGISEARALKEAAGRRAVASGKRVFVIVASVLTVEAQNALLKIFEEPGPETHFFLLVPSFEILLLTLRSRMHLIAADNSARTLTASPDAEKFLSSRAGARLEFVKGLLSESEEGARSRGVAFLRALELKVARAGVREGTPALSEILLCARYARDRSPSFKLLLEHLALTLPVTK